ncbi:hypothetical protein H310_13798 [Aphanomyces invadans]|uniref:MARVEL domain-containing protein n=1 Tax=Aphanomyces invadans TaxID=157072 RepID=A0A024TEE4_9STRA|nr:hypothetical protein H310_13798 [Aphanomyces invadans]ETV91732.1 hypothetical protein H310_13798 [Aphanomyces invadans]RHY31881.1 hypothetical protein DYB32_003070 [Aphanomyces invadans]|eukprot:XP_008879658.1 hypothetical protein H310_13798 [Aphanomyces invadans]
MTDLSAFTQFPGNKVFLARAGVFVATVISFFTCTRVTGISEGDYAFLVSFIALSYVLLHSYFVTFLNAVSFVPQTQLIVDGVLTILLLAGAIALASFRWLPGAGVVAVIFLFIATLFQAGAVALQWMERNSANNSSEPASSVDAPGDFYIKATTPVGEAPIVKEPEHSAV